MTKLVDISMFKAILLPTYMILMYIIWRFPKTEEPLNHPGACLSGRLSRRPDALAAWAELEESLEFKG